MISSIVPVGLVEWFAHADAGVVDQDIDPAVVGEHSFDHAMDLLGSPTSQPIINDVGLVWRTCLSTSLSLAMDRPQPMTTAPRWRKSMASCLPMPLEAPVIKIIWLSNSIPNSLTIESRVKMLAAQQASRASYVG